jgi:hypothetical protein
LKGWHRDTESGIYFKINLAKEKKIATFAARFGRTESQLSLVYWKANRERKRLQKIKFILFGSLKKFLTFALPTERNGEKSERRMSGR